VALHKLLSASGDSISYTQFTLLRAFEQEGRDSEPDLKAAWMSSIEAARLRYGDATAELWLLMDLESVPELDAAIDALRDALNDLLGIVASEGFGGSSDEQLDAKWERAGEAHRELANVARSYLECTRRQRRHGAGHRKGS
jgi:hypothetical protein